MAVAFFVSGGLGLLGVLEWWVGLGGWGWACFTCSTVLFSLAWGVLSGPKEERGDDSPFFLRAPVVAYVSRVR